MPSYPRRCLAHERIGRALGHRMNAPLQGRSGKPTRALLKSAWPVHPFLIVLLTVLTEPGNPGHGLGKVFIEPHLRQRLDIGRKRDPSSGLQRRSSRRSHQHPAVIENPEIWACCTAYLDDAPTRQRRLCCRSMPDSSMGGYCDQNRSATQ